MHAIATRRLEDLLFYLDAVVRLLPPTYAQIVNDINRHLLHTIDNASDPPQSTPASLLFAYCSALDALINAAQQPAHSRLQAPLLAFLGRCSAQPASPPDVAPERPPPRHVAILITFAEAFNGCTKRVRFQANVYTLRIPPYSFDPFSVAAGAVVFDVEVAPDNTYTVFDNVVFCSVAFGPGQACVNLTLPDGQKLDVPRSHIAVHRNLLVRLPNRHLAVVPYTPLELMRMVCTKSHARALNLPFPVGMSRAAPLHAPSAALHAACRVPDTTALTITNPDLVVPLPVADSGPSVAITVIHNAVRSPVTLRNVYAYPGQTYVVTPDDSPQPVLIKPEFASRVTTVPLFLSLAKMALGTTAIHDQQCGVCVEVPANSREGDCIFKRVSPAKAFSFVVHEKPSKHRRVGDDVMVTITHEPPAGPRPPPVAVATFARQSVPLRPSYEALYRVVGGGLLTDDGSRGDLLVTFAPTGEVIKETTFYQIKAFTTVEKTTYAKYFARQKTLGDGTRVPKTYRVPTSPDPNYRKKPYYVLYRNDGDWNHATGAYNMLVLVVSAPSQER